MYERTKDVVQFLFDEAENAFGLGLMHEALANVNRIQGALMILEANGDLSHGTQETATETLTKLRKKVLAEF